MPEQIKYKLNNHEVTPPPAAWECIAQRLNDDAKYAGIKEKMHDYDAHPPTHIWDTVHDRINDDKEYAFIKAKMNDYHVDPPTNIWKGIHTTLNDDKELEGLRTKMGTHDVAPPSTFWENITARLDDDKNFAGIKVKMNDYGVHPPTISWENIVNGLNEEKNYAVIRAKMTNYSIEAPTDNWNKILGVLDQTKSVPSVAAPVIKMGRKIYRIAAAAIVIGLVIGGWLVVNKKTFDTELTNNNTSSIQPEINKNHNKTIDNSIVKESTENKVNEGGVVIEEKKLEPIVEEVINTTTASTIYNKKATLKYAKVETLPTKQQAINVTSSPIRNESGVVIRDIDLLNTSNNYIVVAGPNGQLTRISSKFANVLRYLNEDNDEASVLENIDIILQESGIWKKRFREWRNKISQSNFTPSSTNFLDIIEFKELIEDKK